MRLLILTHHHFSSSKRFFLHFRLYWIAKAISRCALYRCNWRGIHAAFNYLSDCKLLFNSLRYTIVCNALHTTAIATINARSIWIREGRAHCDGNRQISSNRASNHKILVEQLHFNCEYRRCIAKWCKNRSSELVSNAFLLCTLKENCHRDFSAPRRRQ